MTIHGIVRNSKGEILGSIPLVYILMIGKRESDYEKVFDTLIHRAKKEHSVDLVAFEGENKKSREIMFDFEKAERNAAGKKFNCKSLGCLVKRLNECGLKKTYTLKGHNPFRHHMRMLMAMAFIPPQRVENCTKDIFKMAKQSLDRGVLTRLKELESYFMLNWGSPRSRYPPTSWTAYDKDLRTNNFHEGWHFYWLLLVKKHPRLDDWIRNAKMEEGKAILRYEMLTTNGEEDTLTRQCKERDSAVVALQEKHGDLKTISQEKLLEFIDTLAHHLHPERVENDVSSSATPVGLIVTFDLLC